MLESTIKILYRQLQHLLTAPLTQIIELAYKQTMDMLLLGDIIAGVVMDRNSCDLLSLTHTPSRWGRSVFSAVPVKK